MTMQSDFSTSLFADATAETPLTLREFAERIGRTVNANPALRLQWVTAELSDVRTSGGHCYMQLVEKDPSGANLAQMRANVWRSTWQRLAVKFRAATGRDICAGIKVMLRGSATFHNVFGLSFNVIDIDPAYTMGDLERRRREILRTLTAEGVIDRNKQEALAPDACRIAVISAAGAAGYGDFVDQLQSNSFGYRFYTHLFPAVMQGERTPSSVLDALEQIEMTYDLWDCVAIIRGGGATNDLVAFDDLALARRVATFPLPVVVGIGHERDNTVLDYIAHTRCKTPTAVAAFLIENLQRAETAVLQMVSRIAAIASDAVAGEQRRLDNAASLIPALASGTLRQAGEQLHRMASMLPLIVGRRIDRERQRLDSRWQATLTAASRRIADENRRLDRDRDMLPRAALSLIAKQDERLNRLASLAAALSPDNTLRRGYSLTLADGHVVTDPSQLTPGMKITTRLKGGEIDSTVDNTHIR